MVEKTMHNKIVPKLADALLITAIGCLLMVTPAIFLGIIVGVIKLYQKIFALL